MKNKHDYADQLIQLFGMQALPEEGGFYVETYRSAEIMYKDPSASASAIGRPYGTSILYLLTASPKCFSALHSLPTDEIYHFYLGDPVEMLLLSPDGNSERIILGQKVLLGQKVQFVVPRKTWQGSRLMKGSRYALMGTTMAPGFVASDYRAGHREELVSQYPEEAVLIRQLTTVER